MKIELVLEAEKEELRSFADLLRDVKSDMECSEQEKEMLTALISAVESVTAA